MTNKLHTSVQTQEIFFALGQSLGLQPYILSKLAIALSIRQGKLKKADYDFAENDNNADQERKEWLTKLSETRRNEDERV